VTTGPDFICIGAQKAGTTWLYDNIRHHPDIWLPPIKELHYFDNKVPNKALLPDARFDHGGVINRYSPLLQSPDYETLRWLWRFNHHGNDSMAWYKSLFTKPSHIMGDITPMYSTLDERGVEYVKSVVGDRCKVFLVLREPVSRSWSAVKMVFRWKISDIRQEDYAVLVEEMKKPYSVLRTDYSRMIKLWRQYFSEDNFKVFFYDDLANTPELFLNDVLGFVGVDATAWSSSNLGKRSNADGEKISMPSEVRAQMSQFFMPELEALSDLIGGHSHNWLNLARQNAAV
jgi:hypothetical protein